MVRSRITYLLCLNTALLGGLVALFASGELALRETGAVSPARLGWVGQFQTPPGENYVVDERIGWRLKPNHSFTLTADGGRAQTYRSNSDGFRADHDFDPADKRLKIAFVGDSFTFGWGVGYDETFAALVEQNAKDRVAWNFAMIGFGLDQTWLSARHEALPLRPDLMVAVISENAFRRSLFSYKTASGLMNKPAYKIAGGKLVRRTAEQPGPVWMWLDQDSRLWNAEVRAAWWLGKHLPVGDYWRLNRMILDELREDCRHAGVPLLFIYLPAPPGFEPIPMLRRYMREAGANYMDLSQAGPVSGSKMYLLPDVHLSSAGHRAVANLIERWMAAHPDASQSRKSLAAGAAR